MSLAKERQTTHLSPPSVPPSAMMPDVELWSDEPQLETPLHLEQIILMLVCLKWWWRDRQDYFASGNISIYYDREQVPPKRSQFIGPDFFVVLNTQPKERKSWVVWQEDNRFPNVIVEMLSRRTAKKDRTAKKELYQDTFKTPEYFWFHPYTREFAGFRLIDGKYEPIPVTDRGWMWSQELGLYLGVFDRKLRYFTPEGDLVPIPEEQVEIERVRLAQVQEQLEVTEQQLQTKEQQLAELAALLERYRDRFGELNESAED
jgi:Uma2 family endonuclease